MRRTVDEPPTLPRRTSSSGAMLRRRGFLLRSKVASAILPEQRLPRTLVLVVSILIVWVCYRVLFSSTVDDYWLLNFTTNSDKSQADEPTRRPNEPPKNQMIPHNERTKGMLEVLLTSAESPWPSYLKLYRTDGVLSEDNTCIVSAYFQVRSKHSGDSYATWMGNFLSMQDCMVIFCDEGLLETILQQRSNRPTAIISMNLTDLPIAHYNFGTADSSSSSPEAFWQHQLDIDPEKKIHKGYEVFWIWLSKAWFVTTAAIVQTRLFDTNAKIDVWMWADIGSFRRGDFKDRKLLQHVNAVVPDSSTVVWMAHRKPDPPDDPYWTRKLVRNEKHHFYHSGSHAIGTTSAWVTFYTHFVRVMDEYAQRGLFVGEDQCVLQSTCLLYPDSCAYIPSDQVPDNRYWGLRTALYSGPGKGKMFELWRAPAPT